MVKFDPALIDDDLTWIDDTTKTTGLEYLLHTAGITDKDERKKLASELKSSPLIHLLRKACRQRYQLSQTKISPISDPTWPYQVAYLEGYRKALRELYISFPDPAK